MPLRTKEPFFNVRKKVPMASRGGGGARVLSGRATNKRIFAASLSDYFLFIVQCSVFTVLCSSRKLERKIGQQR